ncbi:MAG: hypothetical protein E4H01_15045 [Lysobacterales bacterium]|nr:MAG: hypothetical protein E4H01_15045 [Xanthomonadales bacterium]
MNDVAIFSVSSLAKYEAACRAVAECAQIDEAKDYLDKSEAMRVYARQAKNRQLEMQAAEIRFRAERRIGELMEAQGEAGLLNKGGGDHRVESGPGAMPTLAEAGINKHLADRARKMAAIPEAEFNGIVDDWRGRVADENERVTINLLDAAKKHVHVGANSGNNEWYTPKDIIERARTVLDGIDLDPASSLIANKIVCATKIFTVDDDGLKQPWAGNKVWMNPPYSQPLIGQFCEHFTLKMLRGSTGVALVNNATETAWFQMLASCATAICFPSGRVRFRDPDGKPGAPLQGQAIIYAGPRNNLFMAEFRDLGFVVRTA